MRLLKEKEDVAMIESISQLPKLSVEIKTRST